MHITSLQLNVGHVTLLFCHGSSVLSDQSVNIGPFVRVLFFGPCFVL